MTVCALISISPLISSLNKLTFLKWHCCSPTCLGCCLEIRVQRLERRMQNIKENAKKPEFLLPILNSQNEVQKTLQEKIERLEASNLKCSEFTFKVSSCIMKSAARNKLYGTKWMVWTYKSKEIKIIFLQKMM